MSLPDSPAACSRAALQARAEAARRAGVDGAVAERAVDLAGLDGLDGDCLGLFCWADRRPLAGVAALVDWRICGALSRARLRQRFGGARDESMMLPVGGRFGPRRLFVLGLGPEAEFTVDQARHSCRQVLVIMARAGATRPLLAAAASRVSRELEPSFVRAAREEGAGAIAEVLSERHD